MQDERDGPEPTGRACRSTLFCEVAGRVSESVTRHHEHNSMRGYGGLRLVVNISATPRRFDRGDVDFLHTHHGIECTLCFIAAGRQRLCQHARRNLPGDAPLVLAPAARTLLASIADNGVPVAVGLLLIIGGDLKRESFVMLERGTAVEADAGDAGDCEFHRQHVALLAGWVVTGCTVGDTHCAVGKGFGVEAGSRLCILIVPQQNRVLGHCVSFRSAYAPSAGFYRCRAVSTMRSL